MGNKDKTEDRQAISSFYNEFKKEQALTGVNLRHYLVFDKCIKAGLKKNYNVLEIGCGIGTFTKLLSGFIKDGNIVAADISNESIELARSRMGAIKNTRFIVSDMTDFKADIKFDFVVMVDVLEHIPFEQYDNLFSVINSCSHENSVLAINIPHPDMIRFLRKTSPEKLQIIDNSVDMDFLAKHIYNNGFRLASYLPYSIHNLETDYVFITFLKKNYFQVFHNKPKNQIKVKKLIFRSKYHISRLFV
jgi:cyclopropane fatty-acyl-phospholipid synthase-like methyltransferase